MKRKIACFAAVFCLLLSAVCLPCAVLAEGEFPDDPFTESTGPDASLIQVEVALSLQISAESVEVTVLTSDGSVPLGLPVVLAVDGATAAEGFFVDNDITLPYSMTKVDRTYRVYTENFEMDGKVYLAAMAEASVDYDDYHLNPGFFMTDDFNFDSRAGTFELTWNYASYGNVHGADISAVLLDGKPVPFSGEKGTLSADLSSFANGQYTLELVLSAGELSASVDMGQVRLAMDFVPLLSAVQENDGRLCVTVTDPWGKALSGIPVTMRVGGTDYLPVRTDADGKAWFTKPAGDVKVSFLTRETEMDGYTVLVGTVLFGETPGVTVPPVVSDTETTGTTVTTRPPVTTERTTSPVTDTTSPVPTVTGSPTTGVSTDGMVALSVTYEQVLESLLGVTAEQMADLGRVYMSSELYNMYVSDAKSSLSLFVRAQEIAVSEKDLSMALQNGGLGRFSAKDAYRICLRLSLVLTVDGSVSEMPMLDGSYVVQLPVPEAMLSADGSAVAFYGTDGLHSAAELAPVDGYIRFVVKQEGTYALIGLYEGAQGGGLFWPIVIIVFGCLLVICGALLLWLRLAGASFVAGLLGGKPAAPAAAAPEEEALTVPLTEDATPAAPSVIDETIAAAAPAPEAAAPAAEEEYEDIFSSAERRDAFNKRDE